MRAPSSLLAPTVAAFTVLAVLLVAVLGVLLWLSDLYAEQEERAADAQRALLLSSDLQRYAGDVQVAFAGRMLTGDPSLDEQVRISASRLEEALGQLAQLPADPQRRAEFAQLRATATDYARGTVARLEDPPEGAGIVSLADVATLQALRRQIVSHAQGAAERADGQRQDVAETEQMMIAVAVLGLVLVLVLVIVIALYVLRRILAPVRAVAAGARALSAGELNAQVPERGKGEVAALARAFNEMSTALQARTEQLHTAERRFQGILQHAAALIDIQDVEGRYLLVNAAFERVWHVDRGDAVGRRATEVLPRAAALPDIEAARAALAGEEIGERELYVEERGERRTYLQARFLLRDEEGRAFATAGLATDVTDRERAVAEAREASRQKSAFLANMSHEIRTPLNAVIGMLDLLVDTPLDSEQEEYAQTARSSGGELLRLIDDILDLSRIEASNLHLEVEDFDLHEAVDDAFDPVAAGAYERGLYLAVEVDDQVPVSVRGDEGRLGQVLRNLLDNAVKFTPAGEVRLRASLSERTAGVDLVRFDVIDTGIGVEAGDEQRLFAPFVQHDASTTRRHGGTGLGLAICRHLVELMGGTIGVDSRRGGGSRFWFTLPFAHPEQPAVSAMAPEIVGLRVLAAADREDERGLLAAGLAALGADTTVVASFDEAVSVLFTAADECEPFDAAVVDWLAPRADWARLAVELHGLDVPHPTRLLALTGGQKDARAARRSGIAAVVPKPVRRSRLREALATAATAPPVVAPPAQWPRSVPRSMPPGTGRTVLVVEDNPVNQRMLVLLLERRGHVAAVASGGEEALERLGEEGVDLVFMDCQMPGLDGYETARRWRRREKGRAHVPIVAVTAHAMVGDRDKCLQAGMDDYLTKPLGADALDSTLVRWLGAATSPAEPAPRIDPGGAVDLSVLAEDFPPDVARDLAERFLVDAAADVEAVTAARTAGDAAAAREAAHRLRSGCLAVGARALNEAALAVERLAADRPAELGAMTQAVEGLLDAWGATREAFGRALTVS